MAKFDNTDVTTLTNDENLTSSEALSKSEPEGKGRSAADKNKAKDVRDTRRKKEDALEGKEQSHSRGHADQEEAGHGHGDKGGAEEESSSHTQQSLQSGQTTVQFSSGGNASFSGALTSLLGLFASSAALARLEAGSGIFAINQSNTFNFRPIIVQATLQGEFQFGDANKGGGIVSLISAQAAETGGTKLVLSPEVRITTHGNITTEEIGAFINPNTSVNAAHDPRELDKPPPPPFESHAIPYVPTYGTIFFFPQTIPFAFGSPVALTNQVDTYFNGAHITPPGQYQFNVLGPLQIETLNNTQPGKTEIATTLIQPNLSTIGGLPSTGNLLVNVTHPNISSTLPSGSGITKGITFTQSGDILINVDHPTSVLVNAKALGLNTSNGLTFRVDASPVDTTTTPVIESPNNPGTAIPTMSGIPKHPTDSFASLGNLFKDSGSDRIVGNATSFAINVPNAASLHAVNLTLSQTNPLVYLDRSTLSNKFVYSYGLIPGTAVLVGVTDIPSSLPSSTIYRHTLISGSTAPSAGAYGNFASFDDTNIHQVSYSTIQEGNFGITFGGNVLDVYGTKYGEGNVLVVNLANTGTFNFGGNTLAGFGTSYGDMQALVINALPGSSPSTLGSSDFNFSGNVLALDVPIASTLYPHLQMLDMEKASNGDSPAHVHLKFQNSIIEGQNIPGSTGTNGNTYFNDIQYLSNVASSTRYRGFLGPVKDEKDANGMEKITTTDKDVNNNLYDNSITFGNNIYTTEFLPNSTNSTPLDINQKAPNNYEVTLLGNEGNLPIAEGNNLYLGVNLLKDFLNIQITENVFRQLDGAANGQHVKTILAADLNTAATFSPLTNTSLNTIDPWFTQYLNSIAPNTQVTGMTITFDNGLGGSLSFIEPITPLMNLVDNHGNPNYFVGGFYDFANLKISVNLSTDPVVALPLNQITASNQLNFKPLETPPFVYGNTAVDAFGNINVPHTPYYNELDNFFDNSLLATYQVQGFTAIHATNITARPTVEYVVAPGVTIDQWGTIDVTTTKPIFETLTITATNDFGSAATTQLFGFLNAPIIIVGDGITLSANDVFPGRTTDILLGGPNSTIIGIGGGPTNSFVRDSTDVITTEPPKNFGSNLIADTAGGATVYGDFINITYIVNETGGATRTSAGLTLPTSPPTPHVGAGEISGNVLTFKENAIYVTDGTVYGVNQKFSVTTQGGSNDTIEVSGTSPLSIVNSAKFNGNIITFNDQTIYGFSGNDPTHAFYGDMQTLSFSSAAGLGSSIKIVEHALPPTTNLDVSSQIEGNIYVFKPVTVIVQGDAAGTLTTVYTHLQNLLIGLEPSFSKITANNEQYATSATFAHNTFEFDDSQITGGLGNLNVYADVNLAPTALFPSPISGFAYNGFLNPVQVTNNGSHIVTTTNDGNANSIIWGIDTFTSGQGTNTYNFTLLQNALGINSNSIPNTYGVFTGIDTVKGFHMTSTSNADVLVLDLVPTLYAAIVQATGHSVLTAADLDAVHLASFDGTGVIKFNSPMTDDGNGGQVEGANGTLTLQGLSLNSFADLGSHLVINEINIPYVAPTLATIDASHPFDPVFINLPDPTGQPFAFAGLVSTTTNFANLSYTVSPLTPLPPGMILDQNGTLHINVTASQDADVTVKMSDGTTQLSQTVHIFAIDAPFIDYDTGVTVNGDIDGGAYELKNASTVYAGGGGGGGITLHDSNVTYGSNLIYVTSSTVDHIIYGDVSKIMIPTSISKNLAGNLYNFKFNLMNINSGPNGTDTIFGVTQSMTIDAPSSNHSVGTNANPNTFIFGTATIDQNNVPTSSIQGNTIYGTNNVYGDMQTLTLKTASSDQGEITHNLFYFGENKLTNGAYLYGTSGLTTPASTTNLYAGVGSLMTDLDPTVSNNVVVLKDNISSNDLVFSKSILNAGTVNGTAQFFTDIGDLSGSDFALAVTVVSTSSTVPVKVMDSYNNSITWSTDTTFVGNASLPDTFNITLLMDKDTGQAVMQGKLIIQNYTSADIINLNLVAPLYATFEKADSLGVRDNRSVQLTDLANMPGVTSDSGNVFRFDKVLIHDTPGDDGHYESIGGQLTLNSSSTSITDLTQLSNVNIGLSYFAEPITTKAAPSQPIIFNNLAGTTYYSVFDQFFKNVDVTNTASTYTITGAFGLVPFPDANNALTFKNNVVSSLDQSVGLNSGVPIVTNSSTPILEYVNVALNDAHFASNHPSINMLVGVFNDYANGVIDTTPTGALTTITGGTAGSVGEQLFQPSGDNASQSAYVFQGNAGDSSDPTTLIVPYGDTSSETFNEGGHNMFIDTVDGTIAYGDYQHILFNYINSPTDTFTFQPIITQNKTYEFKSNAFDINGTVYGAATDMIIQVSGESSHVAFGNVPQYDGSITIDSNFYEFEGHSIYGSGTLIGDLTSLSLNLRGGTGNIGIFGATFDVHATFTNNEFDFRPNIIGAIGSGISNVLYGNVGDLNITQQVGTNVMNGVSVTSPVTFNSNLFNFEGDLLIGGQGTNDYYGHLTSFGNSESSTNNFYSGVNVTVVNNTIEISDNSNNFIIWGNNTYVGNDTATDTYHYTIVGTNDATPKAIMQGNDKIYKFDPLHDKLVFSLSYPVYAALDTAKTTPLSVSQFLAGLTITDLAGDAVLSFKGGGSITLVGLGSQITNYSQIISIALADPISAVANPTSNVFLVGNTTALSSWQSFFNTGHQLSANFGGFQITNGSADYTNVDPGVKDLNTGVVVTSVNNITAHDLSGINVTSTNVDPIKVLALQGATVIDQSTSSIFGSSNSEIIVGHGSQIFGGGQDIILTDANSGQSSAYGAKLIYDTLSSDTFVIGNVENLKYISQGQPGAPIVSLHDTSVTVGNNYIEVVATAANPNFTNPLTLGDFQFITFTAYGANVPSGGLGNVDLTALITNNNVTGGNNTIYSPGSAAGVAAIIYLNTIDGTDQSTVSGSVLAEISKNNFVFGDNDLTATGSISTSLYGDALQFVLTTSLPLTPIGNTGYGYVDNNHFTFGSNELTGSINGGSLYAGVGTFTAAVLDSGAANQFFHSSVFDNAIIFGDSHLTAQGGITNFYGDLGNFSGSYFYNFGLEIANNTPIGVYKYQDIVGNTITFGHDTFTGSTDASAQNIFHVNLFASDPNYLLSEEAMAPGITTINHMNASGSELDLVLSKALDTAITGDPSGQTAVTATTLDNYLNSHFGVTFDTTGSDTTISFHGITNDFTHQSVQLGSIVLTNTNYTSFSDMGSKLQITVGDPISTMSSTPGTPDIYNVQIPGDSLTTYNQTTNIQNLDSLGHIIDFNGTINLNMSNALYKALGLSDTNTAEQNMQILQNDINSPTGGIAVSSTTTGAGATAITNTVLNIEAIHNGVTSTFGTITIADTHFNPLNPLVNHLNIVHH